MPGVTHWSSPNFHAYYPTANSFPAVVGEMLGSGLGCVGFSWVRKKNTYVSITSRQHPYFSVNRYY